MGFFWGCVSLMHASNAANWIKIYVLSKYTSYIILHIVYDVTWIEIGGYSVGGNAYMYAWGITVILENLIYVDEDILIYEFIWIFYT